ncbi:MAG: DUF296 domain-containing protein [Candidatus Thermoplasmatota archaeon]|nr:DUF296 domain-containing protein [Candidatus Thermoplasmatota archaeon]
MKLDSGDNVFDSLSIICDRCSIDSGSIRWGIGMVRDFEIGYLNALTYEKERFSERAEVVSFHGSIASGEPTFHIHASVARRHHDVIGGHLFSAIADPMMEIEITRFQRISLARIKNELSGLNELNVSQKQ